MSKEKIKMKRNFILLVLMFYFGSVEAQHKMQYWGWCSHWFWETIPQDNQFTITIKHLQYKNVNVRSGMGNTRLPYHYGTKKMLVCTTDKGSDFVWLFFYQEVINKKGGWIEPYIGMKLSFVICSKGGWHYIK